MLRPTGHRVLVKPDPPPETTTTGLVLPQDHDHVPVSGVVYALGPGGSLVRYQARQRALTDCAEIVESALRTFGPLSALQIARDEIAGMLGTSDPVRELHVWDRVVFPAEAGLVLQEDGETFILINEDDVVAVAAAESEAA